MTTTIDSGISVKHAKAWTISEALREVVQNLLDVKAEFHCTGYIDGSSRPGYYSFVDAGPGLKIEHLAFGNNDKSEKSIGQFGEGLKSAILTLTRSGRKVLISSCGFRITPSIQVSNAFNVETLHYQVAEVTGKQSVGTRVTVQCTEAEVEEAKAYFAELDKAFTWVEKNSISLPGGSIYVNGSRIGTISDALFSYHLTREQAGNIVNRDRNAVDMDKAGEMIESLIGHTWSTKVTEKILFNLIHPNGNRSCFEAKLDFFSYHDSAWRKGWSKVFGVEYTKVVLSTDPSSDANAAYRGYIVINGAGYGQARMLRSFGIKSAQDVAKPIKASKGIKTIKLEDLSSDEKENLNWVKKTIKKYYGDTGPISVSEELGESAGVVSGVVLGLYSSKLGKIFIQKSLLTDRKALLHTTLHETVHKVSGCDDVTSEFEDALLQVATGIIMSQEKEVE